MFIIKLTVEPEARRWLADKDICNITVGVIVSRGGGCCGGCSFTEAIIDCGKPKEKEKSYLIIEQNELRVYVAKILEKKTDSLTIALKGWPFKRLSLVGYDAECPLNSK